MVQNNLHEKVKRERRSAHRHKVLRFTLKDIAEARGVELSAIHKAIYRGLFNPDDILSIARYVLRIKIEKEEVVPAEQKKGD